MYDIEVIKIIVLWDVMPCSVADRYQHFRQMYSFCVQDRSMKTALAGSSKTPIYQHYNVSFSRTLILVVLFL